MTDCSRTADANRIRFRGRWFTRALRWPDGPTYANEVDAFAALWHLTALELRDKAQNLGDGPRAESLS